MLSNEDFISAFKFLAYIKIRIKGKKKDALKKKKKVFKKETPTENIEILREKSKCSLFSVNSKDYKWELIINDPVLYTNIINQDETIRTILWMKFVAGFSQKEIAKYLNKSSAFVSNKVKQFINNYSWRP